MSRLCRYPRPTIDCKVYTDEPYSLEITSEYTRRPREGLETISTGFGSTIRNFVNRHRRRRNKVLSVTVQATLRRFTVESVINLPEPAPGRGKRTQVFDYTISSDGKTYPLRIWIKTSRGQLLDGEDDPGIQEPFEGDCCQSSLYHARLLVEAFYQI